jgi:hypothetical protein
MRLGHVQQHSERPGGLHGAAAPASGVSAPAHAATPDGVETVDVSGKFADGAHVPAHWPSREALGVVGEQYVPIQNEEHTDLLDALVDESGALRDGGSLRGGRGVRDHEAVAVDAGRQRR